jgi:hypothetical protein
VTVATASGTEEKAVAHVAAEFSYASVFTPAEAYTLRARPGFPIDVEHDGGVWILADPETGVHGAGETPSDAVRDFFRAVHEHVEVLERQAELSADLQAQLSYLRDRL